MPISAPLPGHALKMREDGNSRLSLNKPYQTFATTRHDDVNEICHCQHLTDRRAVTGGNKLDRVCRQARFDHAINQAFMNRAGGVEAFRPAR